MCRLYRRQWQGQVQLVNYNHLKTMRYNYGNILPYHFYVNISAF